MTGSEARPANVPGTGQPEMTDEHRQQLQLIQDRDAELDEELVGIGNSVTELKELARMQNQVGRVRWQTICCIQNLCG